MMKKNFTNHMRFTRVSRYMLFACALTLAQSPGLLAAASKAAIGNVTFQEKVTVKGTVRDDADNLPLPGVTITDSQRKVLGITNGEGNFSITIDKGTELSFNMVGYTVVKHLAADNQNSLSIRLASSSSALDEVVVTALGIKREEKALGYATTTVKGEDLTGALSNNWTDALSGKVAGLNLVRSNGGPGGSNKIILRGENNLTGDNDALIVVDGVVINQGSGRSTAYGDKGYLADETPVDFGNGLGDINPEDIENVTVLKGPGAAALYGQRGANGAIIITTKSGRSRTKGIGVTFTSNSMIESVNRWPDLQYEYGQGDDGVNYYSYNASEDGASTRSTSSAWGPKFDGQEYYQYDPVTHTKATVRTPWVPYVNDSRNFFETGKTFTNSVTVDGASDKTSARFSATNVNNSWIIPNTGYKRNTVALSVNQKVTDKLQIAAKVNYTNKWSDNLPSTGYNNQSIMYWYLFWEPNASLDWLKDYWMPDQENVKQSYPFSSYPDNPYLIANQMLNKSNRNGITGNVQATYDFTKELSLTVRTALDFAQEQRSQQRPYDTEKYKKGLYRTQNIFSQEVTSDFLLRYNKKLNKDFTVSATGGGSMTNNTYNRDDLRSDSLSYPGIFTHANAAGVTLALPYKSKYSMNSFYGLFTASYKNFLFLDATARWDWNSTLATPISTNNTNFFYPSLNGSIVLSEILKMPEAITFAKLRASISGVGSGGTRAYLTSYGYNRLAEYPGGAANPTLLPNPDLESLFTTSYEFGTDLRFFKGRIGVDLTYYTGNTKNQILSTTIDAASGMRSAVVNAGMISNSGIELALNGSPLKSKRGFNWNVFGTFTANRNEVLELTQELEDGLILQNGPGSRGAIIAKIGGGMGDLYGRGYLRAPDGQIIYDDNGIPQLTEEMMYIGNTNPQWKASLGNTFKYRQFTLNFLVDGQYGAKGYSMSAAKLAEQGKTVNTLPGRYNGIIGNGVQQNADGSFRPNDIIAQDVKTYYNLHYGLDNVEGTTYSTDFLKLREMRLDYTFTPTLVRRLGLQRATVGVYGRDLLVFTSWPIFDPEFGTLSGAEINKGFEYGQFPSTRSFGINFVIGI